MKAGAFSQSMAFGVAGAAFLSGAAVEAQPVVQKVIAVSGTAAPGTEAGTTFYPGGLGLPTVNARGDVAFGAMLDVASKDWFRAAGIWYAPGGGSNLPLAYRVGDWSSTARTPFLDNAGRIAFWTSEATAPAELRVGLPGQYRTVVRLGDPAPGTTAGQTINERGSVPVLSGTGDLYFEPGVSGSATSGTTPAAYTVVAGGSPQVLRYWSQAAPGVPGGKLAVVDGQSFADGGRAAFVARISYSGTPSQGQGVFAGTAGNLARVAISGQAASGSGAGYTFVRFMPRTGVNASGETVFSGVVKNAAGVTSGTYAYRYDGQQLAPMAGPGTAAPALGTGVTLKHAQSQRINDRGQALVQATAVGPNAGDATFSAWMRWAGGILTPIVRDGMAAPGLGSGVTLKTAQVISFNDAGQSLVQATLAGPGVDSTNGDSLWAVDPLGQFTLVARTGTTLSTPQGNRVVTGLRANAMTFDQPMADPVLRSLSDSGQVAYQAFFGFDGGNNANVLATLPAIIPGDANNDLIVNTTDFEILYRNLYKAGDRTVGDFNGDGRVSFSDYQILERNFGKSVDGSSAGGGIPAELAAMVPEPGGLGVIACAALAGAMRRRRRVG